MENQSEFVAQKKWKNMSKWTLIFAPLVAFQAVLSGLLFWLVWVTIIGSDMTSDPSSTPASLLKEIGGELFSYNFLFVVIVFVIAFVLYKREKYLLSMLLSVAAALAGVALSNLVL